MIDYLQQQIKSVLPARPYCANEFSSGLQIRGQDQALQHQHIQLNHPSVKRFMLFDLDHLDSAIRWDNSNSPPPNLSIQNPRNGHAHLVYLLASPINTTSTGSRKAIQYAAAIEQALGSSLGADPSYSGLLVKNPFHPKWRVTAWTEEAYSLDYLADWRTSEPQVCTRKPKEAAGEAITFHLGRNCHLFESARVWAYRAIREHSYPAYHAWLALVLEQVAYLNSTLFSSPLPFPEVKSTAKSIARFTHRAFSAEKFSQIQAQRGRKGGLQKGAKRRDALLPKARELKASGLNLRQIEQVLDVPYRTLCDWLK